MRPLSPSLVVRVLAFFFIAVPQVLFGQSKGDPSAAEPGWGSVWREPANEQQRKQQALFRELVAAQTARNYPMALTVCDQLVALSPESPGPYMNRAIEHTQLKQYDRALVDLDEAQERAQKQKNPDASANVMSMRAEVHVRQKDYAAAVSDLQTAIKFNHQSERAYNDLAWLRATSLDAAYRDGPESVRLAQKAVSLATQDSYAAIDTLAASYAEANEFPRAVESEKRAMTAAEKEIKDAARAQKFQKEATGRLHFFEQHRAYRADLHE